MTQTIQVFVGCDPNNCDLEQMMVLEYSLRKHTSHPVNITWMQLSHDTNSPWYTNQETGEGWRTEKWATPFSGFRWAIPESCNFEGRAQTIRLLRLCPPICLRHRAHRFRYWKSVSRYCLSKR